MTNSQFTNEHKGLAVVFNIIVELKPEIRNTWKDPKGISVCRNIDKLDYKYDKFFNKTFEFFNVLDEAVAKGNSLL